MSVELRTMQCPDGHTWDAWADHVNGRYQLEGQPDIYYCPECGRRCIDDDGDDPERLA